MKGFVTTFWLLLFITLAPDVLAQSIGKPNPAELAPIAEFVKSEIDGGRITGAVVLVGNRTENFYLQAVGQRAKIPSNYP